MKKLLKALHTLATFGTTGNMPRILEIGYSCMFWFLISLIITGIIIAVGE